MIKLAAGFNKKIAKVGKSSFIHSRQFTCHSRKSTVVTNNMMALFYSRVSVRHTIGTVIQHAQCLRLKQRHSFYYTCTFPTVTCQNVFCEKGLLALWELWDYTHMARSIMRFLEQNQACVQLYGSDNEQSVCGCVFLSCEYILSICTV